MGHRNSKTEHKTEHKNAVLFTCSSEEIEFHIGEFYRLEFFSKSAEACFKLEYIERRKNNSLKLNVTYNGCVYRKRIVVEGGQTLESNGPTILCLIVQEIEYARSNSRAITSATREELEFELTSLEKSSPNDQRTRIV